MICLLVLLVKLLDNSIENNIFPFLFQNTKESVFHGFKSCNDLALESFGKIFRGVCMDLFLVLYSVNGIHSM